MDATRKKIIDGLRKAFTIGFGTPEQHIFAITERLLPKNKSAFEPDFTSTFLDGLWKCFTARF